MARNTPLKRSRGQQAASRPASSPLPIVALVVLALGLVGLAIRVALKEPAAPAAAASSEPALAAASPAPSLAPRAPRSEQAPPEPTAAPRRPEPIRAASPAAEPEEEEVDEPEAAVAPQPEGASAWVRGATEKVHIKRTIDGDTVELADGRRLRLIGINTPEKKGDEPLNREAAALLRSLAEGKDAVLEYDAERIDQYKRTLGYLHVGELFVNGEIVRQGLAYCYTWEPNSAHKDGLLGLQKEARLARRGLWGLPLPAPESEYVATARGHHFHRPSCASVQRVRRDNRVVFKTRDAALDAGQNPCKTCRP